MITLVSPVHGWGYLHKVIYLIRLSHDNNDEVNDDVPLEIVANVNKEDDIVELV